jgi:hypothetical protein
VRRTRRLLAVLALVGLAGPVLAQAPRKDDSIQAEQRKLRQTEQQLRDEKRKAAEARARETSLLADLDQTEQELAAKQKEIARLDGRIGRTQAEVTVRSLGRPACSALRSAPFRMPRTTSVGAPDTGDASPDATRTSPSARAATSAISGSALKPLTSLTILAPVASAAAATLARVVSAEIGTSTAPRSASSASTNRRNSSSSEIAVRRYGAVDIAPMSMKSAPSATACCAAARKSPLSPWTEPE